MSNPNPSKSLECNCDPGDAHGHHVWCDTYRPAGMTDADWESALQVHPML